MKVWIWIIGFLLVSSAAWAIEETNTLTPSLHQTRGNNCDLGHIIIANDTINIESVRLPVGNTGNGVLIYRGYDFMGSYAITDYVASISPFVELNASQNVSIYVNYSSGNEEYYKVLTGAYPNSSGYLTWFCSSQANDGCGNVGICGGTNYATSLLNITFSLPGVYNHNYLSFVSQSPSNLTVFNTIGTRLNITYYSNVSNPLGFYLNYTLYNPPMPCIFYLNGSCYFNAGQYYTIVNESYDPANLYGSFYLDDNELLSASYYVNESFMEDADKSAVNLNSTSAYFAHRVINLTTNVSYGWAEVMVNLSSSGTFPVELYYCNETYGLSGNPRVNSNCAILGVISNPNVPGHSHGKSSHSVLSFVLQNKRFNNIDLTATSYILVRGRLTPSVNVWGVYNESFNASFISNNNGAKYSNLSYFVPDLHIHQFSNTSYNITYQACVYNASFANCSDFRSDILEPVDLAPIPGVLTYPRDLGVVLNDTVNMTWLSGMVESRGVLSRYNLSLYYTNNTFYKLVGYPYLNTSFYYRYYAANVSPGFYIINLTTVDSLNLSSEFESEEVYFNYTSRLSGSVNFTLYNGFNDTRVNVTYYCNNSLGNYSLFVVWFNGVMIANFSGNANQTYYNTTYVSDGYNYANLSCRDFYDNQNFSYYLSDVQYSTICIIDEKDNTLFNVRNLSSVRLYYDDNSSYFNFYAANRSCVNFTNYDEQKLRLDLVTSAGTVINRYMDSGLLPSSARICANKDGVTHYEQLIISASVRPVSVYSVYANCLIAADYTRFAYQDAYLLKAYSVAQSYYLNTFVDDMELFFASLDGSIASYVNLDTLEFKQNSEDISLAVDALSVQSYGNSSFYIYYINLDNSTTAGLLTVTREDTGDLIINTSSFANPNNITVLVDYSIYSGITNLTTFKVSYTATGAYNHTLVKYVNGGVKGGNVNSKVAFTVAFLLMVFGLTFAVSRITFSWFGIFVCLASIAVTAFAVPAWYITFLQVLDVIILVFMVISMSVVNYKTVT